MFQSKKPYKFKIVGGGTAPGEIERVARGNTALRVLRGDDGEHQLQIFSFGGWRDLSFAELKANVTAYPLGWRAFCRRYFPAECDKWGI
jgi:hypothetical protein